MGFAQRKGYDRIDRVHCPVVVCSWGREDLLCSGLDGSWKSLIMVRTLSLLEALDYISGFVAWNLIIDTKFLLVDLVLSWDGVVSWFGH